MENTSFPIIKPNYTLVPIQYYMKFFHDSLDMWMHSHEYLEIMYVNSGSVTIRISKVDNVKQVETRTLTQGQFIFLQPNLFHQMIIEKDKTAFVYNIEFIQVDINNELIQNIQSIINVDFRKLFTDTKLSNFINSESGYIIASDSSQVGTAIKELILATEQRKKNNEDFLSVIIKEINLLVEISNCIVNKKLGEISYIRKANSYIMENYQRKITIDEIAEHVNISKSYLEHQYKKQMGQTILGFVNLLRVQKACKLLVDFNSSINDIAITVGYKDKKQLNYEFKKIIGMTPREYRKKNDNAVDHFTKDWFSIAIEPNED